MSKISVLGSDIVFEFEGNFANATFTNNLILLKNTSLMQSAKNSQGPCEIVWRFTSSGGERTIYAAYASDRELPCELSLNGAVLQSYALFEATGGTSERSLDWRLQTTTTLVTGENVLSLFREGDFPRVAAVGVGSAPKSHTLTIDEYAERLTKKRNVSSNGAPFSIASHNLFGLVTEIQGVSRDEAALTSFRAMLTHFVDAVARDASDGQARIGFGGPLNGQRFRQQIFSRLLRLGVDAIVETGAYLGTSTAFFARQGLPVHSCEFNAAYFAGAVVQTATLQNVSLYLQDSRSFLHSFAARPGTAKFPFFYLDAHWQEDLPLADEISIIKNKWDNFVIMVDDFCVPGTAYGYDRYGNGLELTLSYLVRNSIDLADVAVLFPSATFSAETGKRRGTLVLVPNTLYQENLIGERLLYRYAGDDISACGRE